MVFLCFIGDALYTDQSMGMKVFEAMDFGTEENPLVNPQRVILRCYSDQESCYRDVSKTSTSAILYTDHKFVSLTLTLSLFHNNW